MNRRARFTLVLLLPLLLTPPGFASEGDQDPIARMDFRKVVRAATDKVFPAVVFLKCIRESRERGETKNQVVYGSGVLLTPDGELLTNWHVVEKAAEVRCLLQDGRHFDAEVRGTDKDTDLALVRLKMPPDEPPVPHAVLGDSSRLREGDFVMAMGAPWGMARSVSIGIVACTRRFLPGSSEYSLWLQTDASISPGNSGGPLVNTEGHVVGINTRATTYGGDLGFSIPSATVRDVVAQIREHGRMLWSWTGLQLQPLRDFDRNIFFAADAGVMVGGTDPDSPAAAAGIEPRDRITHLNGGILTATTEEDLPHIRRVLGTLPLGQPATLTVVREEETLTIELTPREKGAVEGEELTLPRFDFTAKTINQFDNPGLYFHRHEGVFVYGVRQPGNAASSRLGPGDILLKIDGREVKTLADLKKIHEEAIANVQTKHRVLVAVLRGGLLRQVVLDFDRDYEKE
jgi:serine protease Do